MKIPRAGRMLALLSLSSSPRSLIPGVTFANGAPPAPPVDVDVVIVGGGYSGLMSAYDLQQAGLTTVVLEAKASIGGRSRTAKLQSGPGLIELGATWINNKTQPAVFALSEHFGLETIEQYTEGDSVFQDVNGKITRSSPSDEVELQEIIAAFLRGDISEDELNKDDLLGPLLQYKLVQLIGEASEQVDIKKLDQFPQEEDVTFAKWVEKKGLWKFPEIRALCSSLTSSLVGREPEELGAHYILDYIKSGGGLESLAAEGQDGAQSLMIKEGTTAIATSLADAMTSGSVVVDSPVTGITQRKCASTVLVKTKNGASYQAKKVILANPTNTYAGINFSPPLPKEKQAIVSKTMPGIYAKMILTYSEAWWRTAGLVGKFTSLIGPFRFSWDISVPELSQYSVAGFVGGNVAARWHNLSDAERRESMIEHFAELVGEDLADRARDVLEVNYVEWTKEEYLEGGPTSSMGPGLLRKYGKAMREPFGDLHFAGGEMAFAWKGYLEGAITAGQTAAKEVIEALKSGDKDE